jgi:glyoxylase I family protein
MKLEHLALNVADPRAMAAWYRQHLGLSIAHSIPDAPYTHFLADSSGTVLLEIYCNPPDQVPVYTAMDPLLLHIAFVSADPDADAQALVAAGASLVQDLHLADGSHVIMLRDPWGLALQLCRRAVSMLT